MSKTEERIKIAVKGILDILHDVPTEKKCRYFPIENQDCLWSLEDENGRNWCNNCVLWHLKIHNDTGVETVYHKHPGATALHASLLKELYESEVE